MASCNAKKDSSNHNDRDRDGNNHGGNQCLPGGAVAPLGPHPRSPSFSPASALHRQIRHLCEERRRTHPSRASGIKFEAVPGSA
eukprot:6922564-Alexandrium_andersonii.AAC.1